MLTRSLLIALLTLACVSAHAQSSSIQLLSPYPNQQVCLGTDVPIMVRVTNPDSVPRRLGVLVVIHNSVTGIVVAGASLTSPAVAPHRTFDTLLNVYRTNPNTLSQLGTFEVFASLDALDSNNEIIATWPYAREIQQRLFGIRRTGNPFQDASNNYGHTVYGNIPDQTRWVSLGASVIDAEVVTWDPPPPSDAEQGYGSDSLHAPLIQFDRRDMYGAKYSEGRAGDTLLSFPINILSQTKLDLTFDFLRGAKRTITRLTEQLSGSERGDSLLVEFADPADTACDVTHWNTIMGIPEGHDIDFQTLTIHLDPTHISWRQSGDSTTYGTSVGGSYFSAHFRFRIRLAASVDTLPGYSDDDDPWFIDNVALSVPRLPEIEVVWARVASPYTVLSYSQASSLPVYAKIKASSMAAIHVPLRVTIQTTTGREVYRDRHTVDYFSGGHDTVIRFADWDVEFEHVSDSPFLVRATVDQPGFDNDETNNTASSQFYLNLEHSDLPGGYLACGYDDAGLHPTEGSGNDIPALTGLEHAGVGFLNSTGSFAMRFTLPRRDTVYGASVYFGAANQSADPIRISLAKGDSITGLPSVELSSFQDSRRGGFYDQFWPYYFPKSVVVDAGTYWIVVSQLANESMELGGDLSRSAIVDAHPVYRSEFGTQRTAIENDGNILGAFAVESPAGSGAWKPWLAANEPREFEVKGNSYLPMIRALISRTGAHSEVSESPASKLHLTIVQRGAQVDRDGLTIQFDLPEPGYCTLELYDALGRQVRTIHDGVLASGLHRYTVNPTDRGEHIVASGMYIVQLRAGDQVESILLTVTN